MPPPGGLVLKNVMHDGHNFAKDIRMVGLWIEIEMVDAAGNVTEVKKTPYALDSSTFTVLKVEELVPKPLFNPVQKVFNYLKEADAALEFATYFKEPEESIGFGAGKAISKPGGNSVACGVSASFIAPRLLAGVANCNSLGLFIKQIFLFSRYSNKPAHEPTGVLNGARCHPMVHFDFLENPAFDENKAHARVSSIRFDFRLHLSLDRHYDETTNAGLQQLGNQAGIFADSDSVPTTVVNLLVGGLLRNVLDKDPTSTALSNAIFDAVEKPVLLEATIPGLIKGFPFITTSKKEAGPFDTRCWDNIHWWGSRGPGMPLISAPGAFHCAHMHWRWGAFASTAGVSSDAQFNPQVWPKGLPQTSQANGQWGPLVDPGIWIQSILVAVCKNESKLDPDREGAHILLSTNDWHTLFNPGLRSTPQPIAEGKDIVMWYSAEAHRDVTIQGMDLSPVPVKKTVTYTTPLSGTVFIHGLFFAHEAERVGLKIGSTDPSYRPTDEATIRAAHQWFRTAS